MPLRGMIGQKYPRTDRVNVFEQLFAKTFQLLCTFSRLVELMDSIVSSLPTNVPYKNQSIYVQSKSVGWFLYEWNINLWWTNICLAEVGLQVHVNLCEQMVSRRYLANRFSQTFVQLLENNYGEVYWICLGICRCHCYLKVMSFTFILHE